MHFAGRHKKLDIVWTTTARDWNKSFTHIAVVPEGLAVRVWCSFWPILNHSLLCAFVSVDSSPHFYLLTSATGRIPPPKCGTEPIRYVKLNSLSRSAQLNLKPLQKSRRNHRSYVWTEVLSGYGFIAGARAIRYSGTKSHEARTPLPACSLHSFFL